MSTYPRGWGTQARDRSRQPSHRAIGLGLNAQALQSLRADRLADLDIPRKRVRATKNLGAQVDLFTMSESPTAPPASTTHTLEALDVRLSPAEITSTLDRAARRGEMPGYRTGPGVPLFVISDFGTPFESELRATALDQSSVGNAGVTRIRWELAIKRRLPLVFLVVLVASVWPGVWVTDSMIRTYVPSYDFATWMWYLPLTVPCVPWVMWTSMKKSRASAQAEAESLVGRVRETLGTSVVR